MLRIICVIFKYLPTYQSESRLNCHQYEREFIAHIADFHNSINVVGLNVVNKKYKTIMTNNIKYYVPEDAILNIHEIISKKADDRCVFFQRHSLICRLWALDGIWIVTVY